MRVLIFGTFDGVHTGHEYFFHQAKRFGDELVVSLARDSIVVALKGRPSKHSQMERREMVAEYPCVDMVVFGDEELEQYHVLDEWKPDVIVLGYDQVNLRNSLVEWLKKKGREVRIETIDFFETENGPL